MTQSISITTKQQVSKYTITIESGALSSIADFVRERSSQSSKAVVVSNRKVFGIYGQKVLKDLQSAGLNVTVHLIGDGERYKSLKSLENTLSFFSRSNLSRTDLVVALGGGVVGDLAGFAASVFLRGIPFVQVPTTLLSMIDSSVGGKTGINTAFGKNLVGAFYQPKGVLMDVDVLKTLPKRELTAGFCEAVKQGAISGPVLFNATARILDNFGGASFSKSLSRPELSAEFEKFLAAQISFKALIVAADERESAAKTDAKSRKILNFGHTFGHALEKVTKYQYFKHGEAVGWGISFAAELSKKLELISSHEVKLLNGVVHRAGVLPPIGHIDPSEVFEAFKYDKKNIGSSLQWILLKGIGSPVIVSQENIPNSTLKAVIKNVLRVEPPNEPHF